MLLFTFTDHHILLLLSNNQLFKIESSSMTLEISFSFNSLKQVINFLDSWAFPFEMVRIKLQLLLIDPIIHIQL